MNPRSFYKLLIVSLVAFASAVTVWILTPEYSVGTFFGEPLLPGLIEKINEADVVSIEHAGQTLTFLRDNNGDWTLMEANGYPADKERIRNALIGLAHLEKIEPKTALPEFYPDLQVEDTSETSKSYLVTLLNAEGKQLSSLLVGKNISGITWNGQGYFVRFPDDAQSWLVRGNVDVTGTKNSWLSTRILPLAKGRTGSITLIDGTRTREIVYKRTDPALPLLPVFLSDRYFLTSQSFIEKMEKALTSFDFEEAVNRPANLSEEIPFSSALIETVDGLHIYVFLYLIDSTPYAAVSFAPADNASESVQQEAIDLEALHGKWLYRISKENVSALLPFLSIPEEKAEPSKKTETTKTNAKKVAAAKAASSTASTKKAVQAKAAPTASAKKETSAKKRQLVKKETAPDKKETAAKKETAPDKKETAVKKETVSDKKETSSDKKEAPASKEETVQK
ncbi:MAG: DUF4340 domain-containing protein [Alphaproteobacteria bacterium]|nr:DUF4340 domain-containing protein [Alphaproteobacteria bacterium]